MVLPWTRSSRMRWRRSWRKLRGLRGRTPDITSPLRPHREVDCSPAVATTRLAAAGFTCGAGAAWLSGIVHLEQSYREWDIHHGHSAIAHRRPEALTPGTQRSRASSAAARSRERRWQGLMPAESDIARFFD